MKLSVMIQALQALMDAHGDIPVWLEDPDSGWIVEVSLECTTRMDGLGYHQTPGPLHVAIVSDHEEASRVFVP